MTITGPRLRDYTDTETQRLHVEVDVGTAYEVVLSLFAFGCQDRDEYEVGTTWFEQTYEQATVELKAGLDMFAVAGELLVGLLGIVHELPPPKTAAALVERLESMDPVTLRAHLLRCCAPGVSESDLQAVSAGDAALLERLLGEHKAAKHRTAYQAILGRDAGEFQAALVDTIRRFADEQLGDAGKLLGVLERDAAEKRALAATTDPERLVEQATNGVTFAPRPDVSGVVLIPSIVVRPWVVIAEHGSLRLFAYPVTDDSMAADPDAPPSWMVQFYKALGDERRLRILGIIAEGPIGLADLSDRLELSKSTVHHHVSILRRAGLVLVTVGADKEYSLRIDVVTQARAMLDAYLGERERITT